LDKDGNVVKYYEPEIPPENMIPDIEKLLKE
jgi:glutathione peroxidase-family protein